MSLRPHILGFDLALFRGLLGSGDAAVVERAVVELESRIVPEELPEARDIVSRAVTTGVPFVGLDAEGDARARKLGALTDDALGLQQEVLTGLFLPEPATFALMKVEPVDKRGFYLPGAVTWIVVPFTARCS